MNTISEKENNRVYRREVHTGAVVLFTLPGMPDQDSEHEPRFRVQRGYRDGEKGQHALEELRGFILRKAGSS